MSTNSTTSSSAASSSNTTTITNNSGSDATSVTSTSVIVDNRVSVIKRLPKAASPLPADSEISTPSTSATKRELEASEKSSESLAQKKVCSKDQNEEIEYVSVVKTVKKYVDIEALPCMKCRRACASGELSSFGCGHVICKPCLKEKLQQLPDVAKTVPCDLCDDFEILDEHKKLPFLREVYF